MSGAGRLPAPAAVIVGSTSPAKRRAVEAALGDLYGREVTIGVIAAPSGVSDQPWGEGEAREGAINRARVALAEVPDAELAFGIEAGVSEEAGWPLWAFAWVVALGRDGLMGAARSATFAVPGALAEGVRAGMELGDALDSVYGLTRAKDGLGAVGVLTGGLLDRSELYRTAVLLALMPWTAELPVALEGITGS